MPSVKKIIHPARKHFRLLLSIALIATTLSLTKLGYGTIATWINGVGAAAVSIPRISNLWKDFRHGMGFIDILGILALFIALVIGQDLTALVIATVIQVQEIMEREAWRRLEKRTTRLQGYHPATANIIRGRKTISVKASELQSGDKILIKAGDLVPADSIIISGQSLFNQMIFGGDEASLQKDDVILAGWRNMSDEVTSKVLFPLKDSQLEQLHRLTKTSLITPSLFSKTAAKFTMPYAVAAFIIGIVVWQISHQSIRLLDVLLATTAAPLLLSSRLSEISALQLLLEAGIGVKGGQVLEVLANAKTVVFNKTGVLTRGNLQFSSIQAINPFSKDEVLALAAGLEQASKHPLAKIINSEAINQKIKLAKIKQVNEFKGLGVVADYKGDRIVLGNLNLMLKESVKIPKQLNRNTKTIVYVAINRQLVGIISFNDELRSEAAPAISLLNKIGIKRTVMVTGDNKDNANKIAKSLAIKTVYAETLPGEKLHAIEDIKERPVLFVTCGAQDSAVISSADIGVSLMANQAVSMTNQVAKVIIYPDDLRLVGLAINYAKKSYSVAKRQLVGFTLLSFVLMVYYSSGKIQPTYAALTPAIFELLVILITQVSLKNASE